MEVKNRIVIAPIGLDKMTQADGDWGEKVREYYIARARGGAGLIFDRLSLFLGIAKDAPPLISSFSRNPFYCLNSLGYCASFKIADYLLASPL